MTALRRFHANGGGATHLLSKFRDWAKRNSLDGHLVAYPGTPLEVTLEFANGQLRPTPMLALAMGSMLEQLLQAGEANLRWSPSRRCGNYRPAILVVESEPTSRNRLVHTLERAGYETSAVAEGPQALEAISQHPFDLVLLEQRLPGLDGWGVIRTLHADLCDRELPVILRSSSEAELATLRAARIGARAYLSTACHPTHLMCAIELLTSARRRAVNQLSSRQPIRVEPGSLGLYWFLELLGRREASGLLEIEVGRGSVALLELSRGRVVSVEARRGSWTVVGGIAMDALLESSRPGRFTPTPDSGEAPEGPTLGSMLLDGRERRAQNALETLSDLASRPEQLAVDRDLAQLYLDSVSAGGDAKVLELLEQGHGLDTLTRLTGLDAERLEATLRALLWRGILNHPEAPHGT